MKESLEHGQVQQRDRLRKILLIIAWVLFCLALARPVQQGREIVREDSSKSFYLALDISGSMNHIESDGDSRLQIAKSILTKFIKERENDNLGLIVFGDAPYLQAPLTKDSTVISELIDQVEVGMAGLSTHLGDAIGLAIKMFDNIEIKDKVLIVLTDGNDTGSLIAPREASKIAKERNIKIHTIGFGNPTEVGENPIDVEVLKQISNVTNGKYFLPKSENDLENVFNEINKIEESKINKTSYTPKYELFYYLILINIMIYLFYLVVTNLSKIKMKGGRHV
ncbi:VWA domain-containing protein [Halobacteriovorax sp. DPLXC-1]|uniref:VWA domain-containing protein n=1 Tax=Halobacteriovorax sp. DPLXC-1 TaxID=3110771 RepID=UPI002FF171FF